MAAQPLFIVLCSGEHEKIQMTAMLASVSAVSERPVRVFVSMNAIDSFEKDIAPAQRYRGGAFSQLLIEKKAPDAMSLFDQGKALGDLKIYACSMALDIKGWDIDRLVEGLFDEVLGLTKFLSEAEAGELTVI